MLLLHPRSLAAFPALFALVACGTSTYEPGRPALEEATTRTSASASTATPADLVVSRDACQSDGDCVPTACCHAAACMSAERARPCEVMCTQVCQPGTIDCGGGCLCHEGRCAARLMSIVFK